jgi:hypothetical protein
MIQISFLNFVIIGLMVWIWKFVWTQIALLSGGHNPLAKAVVLGS